MRRNNARGWGELFLDENSENFSNLKLMYSGVLYLSNHRKKKLFYQLRK